MDLVVFIRNTFLFAIRAMKKEQAVSYQEQSAPSNTHISGIQGVSITTLLTGTLLISS